MKKFVIPMMMLASLTAYAGEKGNGGETVDVNGVPRLRDLVEKTTCNWVDGAAMVSENALVNTILHRVSALDWYFAQDLRQEILDLDYCLTSRLVRVDTRDIESFVTVYGTKTTQAAIRFNKSVYLDVENFLSMSPEDRAFLMIHETMHSYLPSEDPMRNQNLRSMVKSIYNVYQGKITTTKAFHTQLQNNGIQFPATSAILAPVKKAVIYTISGYETRRQIILGSQSIGKFFEQVRSIKPNLLADWHRSDLESANLSELINAAIVMEDTEVLDVLLKDSKKTREEALLILLSNDFAKESDAIQSFLAGTDGAENFANDFLKVLASKSVQHNENGRIVVPGMELLSAGADAETPFTGLALPDLTTLSSKAKIVLDLLANGIQAKNEALLKKLFLENAIFYSAFEVKTLRNQIAQAPAFNEMERTTALRKVDILVQNFWELAAKYVSAKTGKDEWKEFVKRIDTSKLGYEIK